MEDAVDGVFVHMYNDIVFALFADLFDLMYLFTLRFHCSLIVLSIYESNATLPPYCLFLFLLFKTLIISILQQTWHLPRSPDLGLQTPSAFSIFRAKFAT